MSPRHLENVFQTFLQDYFKTCLQKILKEVAFSVTIFPLLRSLQDVLQDVFKMFWKTKNCFAEDVLKTSSRLKNICWEFDYSQLMSFESNRIDTSYLAEKLTATLRNLKNFSFFFRNFPEKLEQTPYKSPNDPDIKI